MPLVTFIIPHWNNYLLLRRCLRSIQGQRCRDFSVTVVDNGSADGSPDLLARDFPWIDLIRLPFNTGFCGAVNRGLATAAAPYLALVNNDVEIEPDWLDQMLAASADEPEAGAIACKLLIAGTGEKRISSAGNFILKSGFGRDRGWGEADRGQFDRRERVFWASGGACLIPKRLFDAVGPWDEAFFAYFEDIDIGMRAQLQGFSGVYQPEAVGYHVGEATGGTRPQLAAALRFRNAMMIAIKNFPASLLARYGANILFAHLRALVYLTLKGYLREAARAEAFLARELPRLLRRRREVQKRRRVPVAQVASLLQPEDFSPAAIRGWFGGLRPGNTKPRKFEITK